MAEPSAVFKIEVQLDVHVDEAVVNRVEHALGYTHVDVCQDALLVPLQSVLAAQVGPPDRLQVEALFRVAEPAIPV